MPLHLLVITLFLEHSLVQFTLPLFSVVSEGGSRLYLGLTHPDLNLSFFFTV